MYYPGKKKYNTWLNLSRIIVSNNNLDAPHILHILLENIDRQNVDINSLTDNYIFIALRNITRTLISKENKKNIISYDNVINGKDYDTYKDLFNYDEDVYDYNIDIIEDKMKVSINKVINKLNIFDKQLYDLHFIKNISQREISKEIDIAHTVINKKCNRISNLINLEYDKDKKIKKTDIDLDSIKNERELLKIYNKIFQSNLKYTNDKQINNLILRRLKKIKK